MQRHGEKQRQVMYRLFKIKTEKFNKSLKLTRDPLQYLKQATNQKQMAITAIAS